MATPVVEFSMEGYKIRKVFGKKKLYSNEKKIGKIPMIFDLQNWL
jgi:hypothetical protein